MAVKSAQAKQQRTAAFCKAVETKQLSLRLAGEWFVLPKTTANRTLRYRPAVSAVLQTEEHCMVLHCFLSLALGPQHTTHIFSTPLDFNTDSNLLLNLGTTPPKFHHEQSHSVLRYPVEQTWNAKSTVPKVCVHCATY